jgi:small-conductance mechanosensitive channel
MVDLQAMSGGITLGSVLAFFLALTFVIIIAYICYKAIKALLIRYTSRSFARWAARIVGYIIFFVLLYVVDLYILGLDLNATIASLGIISIALAFASQQVISNLLAGFIIAINRTIRIDDWVEIGGDPTTGIAQVKDMSFTRTILQDRDGRVFMVPNAVLLSSKIVNYSKSGYIEISVPITLPLTIPFDKAKPVILELLSENPEVISNGSGYKIPPSGRIHSSYFFQGYTGRKENPPRLDSRVLLTGITHLATSVSIRFWIADATRKDDIISTVLSEVGRRLNLSESK